MSSLYLTTKKPTKANRMAFTTAAAAAQDPIITCKITNLWKKWNSAFDKPCNDNEISICCGPLKHTQSNYQLLRDKGTARDVNKMHCTTTNNNNERNIF